MNIIIRQPETKAEWNQYYHLRWQILRQPWNQPPGSEKDELEDTSIHRMAIFKTNNSLQVIAVGRLHITDNDKAQIRYMAVDEKNRRFGVGNKILRALEEAALQKNITHIELNARESAVDFYQANHYEIDEAAHTLYDEIRHFKMKKVLGHQI